MILVEISRSWEAFEISLPRVTFLTSSRLTFSKENLQPGMIGTGWNHNSPQNALVYKRYLVASNIYIYIYIFHGSMRFR